MNCFECGSPALQQHHVVPQVVGGTQTVALCEKCHGLVHSIHMTSHSNLTKLGMQKKAAKNGRIGAIPYGMMLSADNITLVKNSDEQEVIDNVICLWKNNYSLRKISAELTAIGKFARSGKAFTAEQIRRIINANIE